MLQLDQNWLIKLGITGLSDDDVQSLLQYVYSELELRVGMKLSENLSDDKLREFEQLAASGDDKKQLEWLETNCPNYKEVVKDELDKLGQELHQNRDKILPAAPQPQGPASNYDLAA